MRRLIAVLALALMPFALFAQSGITGGNTQTQRFTGAPSGSCGPSQLAINNATADFYVCNGGAWVKVGVTSGAGSPAGATGTIQTNGGAGSFGAVTGLTNGLAASCDGFTGSCFELFTVGAADPYLWWAVASGGPAGNGAGCYLFPTDGGIYCSSTDGTTSATFAYAPSDGNTGLTADAGTGATGLSLNTTQRSISIGRFQFGQAYQITVSDSNIAAGPNWGNTAIAQATGADNNPRFTFQAGGTGIAANPTFTFTYANGDFSTGANSVNYVCAQSGGDDLTNTHTVITTTRNQTNQVFTWLGTPVSGKLYEFTCFGAAAN